MSISLCHVTPEANVKAILSKGLRCDHQGFIYFFADDTIRHNSGVSISTREAIASHMRKTVTGPYCVLRLDLAAIDNPLRIADESSFGGQYHWRVKQPSISPEFLSIVGRGEIDQPAFRQIRALFMADEVGIDYSGQSLEDLYLIGLNKKIDEIIKTCLHEPEKRRYYEKCAEEWGCSWQEAIAQLYRWRPETPWFHLPRAPMHGFHYPILAEAV